MNISVHIDEFEKEMKQKDYKIGNALMAIMALVGGLGATITFIVILYLILIR